MTTPVSCVECGQPFEVFFTAESKGPQSTLLRIDWEASRALVDEHVRRDPDAHPRVMRSDPLRNLAHSSISRSVARDRC